MARIIAAAQYAALAGDLEGNLERHLRFAATAATLGVQLLVFPELSLTGYEIARADELVVNPHSAVLDPLRAIAKESSMTIVAGAPVRFGLNDLHIGEFAFLPDGHVAVYTKRYLHGAEREIFTAGQGGPILHLGRIVLAMAISTDISEPGHAANAAANKASVYAASMLVSATGYELDAARLRGYAKAHAMTVLMANHSAPTEGWAGDCTEGWTSAGRSAIWDEQGSLVVASPDAEEALVLGRRRGRKWEGAVFPLRELMSAQPNPPVNLPVTDEAPVVPLEVNAAKPVAEPVAAPTPDQGSLFG
ncbi:carbon-nitrogen hydrolase family protein [Acidicapsa ligni]|uniref:carbon-nitrogen hydrolase family protein n=1 Tax=Acidicapsa ligni TaxID=542300 RepID=UPI0021DF82B1|nr:carbon-nitrogen hydrolase family protein [Acidicapsa ligni]